MNEENTPLIDSELDKPKGVSLKVDEEAQSRSRIARLKDLLRNVRRKNKNGVSEVGKKETQVTTEVTPETTTKTDDLSLTPEHETLVENEEIVKGKQVLAEIVETVRDWEAFKANASVSEEFGVELAGLNLQQLYSRKRQLEQEIIGFTNVVNSPFDLSSQRLMLYKSVENVMFAQNNLAAKKQLKEDFTKINLINDKTRSEALKYVGVDSEEELADLIKQYPSSYDDFNMKPEDADVVWDAVKDALKKDDPRMQNKDYVIKGFHPIWDAEGLVDNIKREEILQKIFEGAKASGNEDLARRMRAQIIYGASISLGASSESDRDLKYQREWFEQKSRGELLASAYYLANFMDKTEGGNDNLQNVAVELGVDAESLGAAFDERSADFYGKAITGDLKIPLDQYPDYFKRLLAISVDRRRLADYAQDFPMEKIATSEYFRRLGDFFASDAIVSETASEKIKAFKMLGNSQTIASKIREGHFDYETLIQKIVKLDDWEKVGARFERIALNGDEEDFLWETSRVEAGRGVDYKLSVVTLPDVAVNVPGISDRLQWRNLNRADRLRLSSQDPNSEVLNTSALTDVGKAILTKAVLGEVLRRSKDVYSKGESDARNRALASEVASLKTGDLLHGTDVKFLEGILYGGDRAGEFLGFDQKDDMTPFFADFSQVLDTEESGEFAYTDKETQSRLDSEFLRNTFAESQFRAIYYGSIASQYGAREEASFTSRDAKSSQDTGVTIIFDRQRTDAFLRGTEAQGHMRAHHALVFVGLPSTEISGLIINGNAVETFEKTKQGIVKNGFYIPIYDLDGNLMFSPEQFDLLKTS